MGDLGLDPETALKLILMVLHGVAYTLAGFALVGFCAYVLLLCLEIFASRLGTKTRIPKVLQPVGSAPVPEQNDDLICAETLIQREEATDSGERRSLKGESEPILIEPAGGG